MCIKKFPYGDYNHYIEINQALYTETMHKGAVIVSIIFDPMQKYMQEHRISFCFLAQKSGSFAPTFLVFAC